MIRTEVDPTHVYEYEQTKFVPPAGKTLLIVGQTLEEITSQLGKQFDQILGRLFLETDIERLWEILQSNGMDAYYGHGWEDFAGLAVGTLIR